ncbi:magnesium citrate secondary transporter [Pontibacter sp. SGAir0037]|uniref:magnesium citrate secondary transporter n=1 Tax=Pontibacter sp. SGAir0037 TaxID=2571030 RepID=UPI0010CD5F7A|nr:magnesium citrate secondary transporter [Pontibacter sp. SGAir0037]QCR24021.1 magnesium citrate secondary transporter [Pontibacter sp. SGAir0037]
MRTLRHPVFLICLILFCINQVLELAHIYIEYLFSYLDDLLSMPIVLTIILTAERLYFSDNRFVLPWHYTLAAVVLFSIFFEWLFPLFSQRHTADAWDMAAYAIGAVLFHFSINKPLP